MSMSKFMGLHRRTLTLTLASLVTAGAMTVTVAADKPKPDFKPFDEVAKDFTKVVSTTEGKSLYGVYVNKKKTKAFLELPGGYAGKKYLFAVTQASGGIFAGLQGPSIYAYWKRYDKRMALIAPEIGTRSTGEAESKSSVKRLFTDRVIIDVPIVAMGPGGQPVIDATDLFAKNGSRLMGGGRGMSGGSINARLIKVTKAKAFPKNVELAFEAPGSDGTLRATHFSILEIPSGGSYKPRVADERIGYFTTVYRDLGKYQTEKKWVRYIDRWHLEKRDPKLKLSPPKQPIVYYLEHTVPVRYRRWIRDGILYWNDAFEQVGFDNAVEVRIQDKATGAHMDKDPEDARYSFIRWLNNDISTAIGPHRSNPLTGQIIEADVVLTDGWIRAYWSWYHDTAPQIATQSMSPETLRWLEEYPQWDPRMLLVSDQEQDHILAQRANRSTDAEQLDSLLSYNPDQAELEAWIGHDHAHCLAAQGLAMDMSFARMNLEGFVFDVPEGGEDDDELDGIPQWFVGPLLSELVAHEVGHTLGLRHNFKASSIYTLDQINSEEWKGKKPIAGSVMDYLPPNYNMDEDAIQGDHTMIGIGPYDMWAIEYGYTTGDTDEILARVAEPELAFLTDDDTSGPDPLARRYDFAADTHVYAESQMELARYHRDRVLEEYVQDGQSWSRARKGYLSTLNLQSRAVGTMANWIGGAYVNRDRKGDPNGRQPLDVVEVEKQREALAFVIENTMHDEAFGLTPEILVHMTVDMWSDQSMSRFRRAESTWNVHRTISGLQNSTITQILNPGTLGRLYDNEMRTDADEDMITIPEVMSSFTEAIYSELDGKLNGETFTDRKPMISSLRRNLQSTMTDRLIMLAGGTRGLPAPVRTLALHHLRDINGKLGKLLKKKDGGQLDTYTMAHLEDLNDRVTKALETVYTKNM